MNLKITVSVLCLFFSASCFVHAQNIAVSSPGDTIGPNPAMPTASTRALWDEQGLLDKQAQQALDANDLPKAEMIAGQGAALGSLSGEITLAQTLYLEGKSQEALQAFQDVVEHRDTQPRSLLPYAILELQAGNWQKALKAYNEATTPYPGQYSMLTAHSNFDPKVPQPDELATMLHIAMGSFGWSEVAGSDDFVNKQNMNEFKKALAIEPNSPIAQLYYAHALLDAGRKSEAKAIFKTVSANSQGDIKADADDALQNILSNVPDTAPVTSSPQQ